MNKSKVRGLKWNLKKLRESILHFTLFIIIESKNKNKNKNKLELSFGQIRSLHFELLLKSVP